MFIILLDSSRKSASFIIKTIKNTQKYVLEKFLRFGQFQEENIYLNSVKFLYTPSREAHSANSNNVLYFSTFYRSVNTFSFIISYTPCNKSFQEALPNSLTTIIVSNLAYGPPAPAYFSLRIFWRGTGRKHFLKQLLITSSPMIEEGFGFQTQASLIRFMPRMSGREPRYNLQGHLQKASCLTLGVIT